MIGTHGRQAPQTTTRYRWEIQWQPRDDDDQWWTDLSELSSLEEAREYLTHSIHELGDRAGRPHRIVRVTETCVYEVVEQGA